MGLFTQIRRRDWQTTLACGVTFLCGFARAVAMIHVETQCILCRNGAEIPIIICSSCCIPVSGLELHALAKGWGGALLSNKWPVTDLMSFPGLSHAARYLMGFKTTERCELLHNHSLGNDLYVPTSYVIVASSIFISNRLRDATTLIMNLGTRRLIQPML